MAKMYMIKNANPVRIKKNRKWRTACLVLAAIVIIEHIILYKHMVG